MAEPGSGWREDVSEMRQCHRASPAGSREERESFVALWGEFCHPDSNAVMRWLDTQDESIKTDK